MAWRFYKSFERFRACLRHRGVVTSWFKHHLGELKHTSLLLLVNFLLNSNASTKIHKNRNYSRIPGEENQWKNPKWTAGETILILCRCYLWLATLRSWYILLGICHYCMLLKWKDLQKIARTVGNCATCSWRDSVTRLSCVGFSSNTFLLEVPFEISNFQTLQNNCGEF